MTDYDDFEDWYKKCRRCVYFKTYVKDEDLVDCKYKGDGCGYKERKPRRRKREP